MRVLVYEWCCSGGLSGPDAAIVATPFGSGAELESVFREGRAMFLATLHDGCRAATLELHALVDPTRPILLPSEVQPHPVVAGEDQSALVDAARGCDAVLVIAPETGGILADRVAAVRTTGVDVIAPGPRFIALAADKQATMLALAAAGVPVPPGRLLAAGEPWPRHFVRPAVGKRFDGVGCDGFVRVREGDPWPPPVDHPLRIEAAVEGLSVGVSCLAHEGGIAPLPPMLHRFSAGGSPGYTGGEPLASLSLGRRATSLARTSIAALERLATDHARGWVGVDMILGPREDGRDDRVLEVNPRLTSSFVGHAAAARTSLLARLVSPQTETRPPDHEPRSFTLNDDGHS